MIVIGSPSGSSKPNVLGDLTEARARVQVVLIGGSAGSFSVTHRLLEQLPPDYRLPVVVVLHRLKDKREGFKEALQIRTRVVVEEPDDKTLVEPGKAYIAPANYHLLFETPQQLALATTELVQFSRPSIDVLFESAADVLGPRVLAILLSGANRDGAAGMYRIGRRGGFLAVQDPADAAMPTMPQAALQLSKPTWTLPEYQLAELLCGLQA